jgi:hypothetical protein
LDDSQIGALPVEWNWLEGYSAPMADPAVVHFTSGVPDMPGYEHVAFSDEWYQAAARVRLSASSSRQAVNRCRRDCPDVDHRTPDLSAAVAARARRDAGP